MKHLVAFLAVLALATVALAQSFPGWSPPKTPGATGSTPCPASRTWTAIDPQAIDTRGMIFEGRQVSSLDTYRVEVISGVDASPAGLVTSTATSGGTVIFTLNPDTGCSPAGCREGRWYQICARPIDANGNRPWACGCIEVGRERFSSPQ